MKTSSRMSADLALRFDRETAPYRGQLYARALRMTRNREDAEDLVQDTMVRACGAFERFTGEHSKAWLHRIMTNAFINDYRRHRREPVITLVGGADQLPAGERAGGATRETRSAEAQVLERLPSQEVTAALAGLPAQFRRALLLTDVAGLSCQETAQVMGTPIGTVMSRLHRARAAVRQSLRPGDPEPQPGSDPTQPGPDPESQPGPKIESQPEPAPSDEVPAGVSA